MTTGRIRSVRALTDAEDDALAAARANLLGAPGELSRAYYGTAIWQMTPVAAIGLGTWAVDAGWRLYIDPDALPGGKRGWTAPNCADVLEHEVNHLLRGHAARMTAHAPHGSGEKRNIAADLEINTGLRTNSFVRSIGLIPENHGLPTNKMAEWYYDHLPADPNGAASHGNGAGDPGDGDGAGQPGADGTGMDGVACGSGAGNPLPGELAEDDPMAPGLAEVDAELARRAVAEAVAEHVAQHGRGTLPGSLSEWATVLLSPPKVPWQSTLRAAGSRGVALARGHGDYSYSRLSRRSSGLSSRIILPGMIAHEPVIDAIVDTSGSVPTPDVIAALSEVEGIARSTGVRGENLRLIMVDHAIQSVAPVWDLTRVRIVGRGGTDMVRGVNYSLALEPPCDLQVILTDGDTPIPDRAPQRRVQQVWVLIGKRAAAHAERFRKAMPWADVVVAA